MDSLITRKYSTFSGRKVLAKDNNQFEYAEGLAICPLTDRIFVATGLVKSIEVLSPTGDFLYSIKDNSQALFCPWGVCFIGGIICVTEYTNHSIVFMTTDGDVVSRAGGNYSIASGFSINIPTRLTAYQDTDIFVCDSGNHRVMHLSSDLPLCRIIGRGVLKSPEDVKVYNEKLFVLDWKSKCVATFSLAGEFISRMITRGCPRFQEDVGPCYCFTIDENGNFILSDSGSDSIRVFSPTGSLIIKIGKKGGGIGEFESPLGVAINSSSQIVSVCRRGEKPLQIF